MSSRISIEFVCDQCSYVETFIRFERNQAVAVAKLDIRIVLEERGWTSEKQIGSSLLDLDFCPHCTAMRRRPSRNHKKEKT